VVVLSWVWRGGGGSWDSGWDKTAPALLVTARGQADTSGGADVAHRRDADLIDSYAAYLAARGMTPHSVRARRQLLEQLAVHAGRRSMTTLGREEVEDWLESRPLKPSTRARYQERIDAFWVWSGRTRRRPRRKAGPGPLTVPAGASALEELAWRYVISRHGQGRLTFETARSVAYACASFARTVPRVPLDELKPRHVEAWLAGLGVNESTARGRLSMLRGFARWAVMSELAARDFTLGVVGPKQPHTIPRGLKGEQVAALLAAVADNRGRLVCLLCVQEGLRISEVASLQVGDVDRDAGTVFVHGKGRRERVLPVSGETMSALRVYLAESPAGAGPLIRSYNDPWSGVSGAYLSRLVARWMGDAGFKERPRDGVGAHSLRHTMATDALRAGAHLRDVQAALGHASITNTQVYLPWLVGDLRTAMGGRAYGNLQRAKLGT
jgi:integrase/recombinase XerC